MSQVVTVEVRIYATRRQDAILKRMGKTYIQTANRVVANMVASEDGKRWSSKDIDTPPSERREEPTRRRCRRHLQEGEERGVQTHPCPQKAGLRLEQSELFLRLREHLLPRLDGREVREDAIPCSHG